MSPRTSPKPVINRSVADSCSAFLLVSVKLLILTDFMKLFLVKLFQICQNLERSDIKPTQSLTFFYFFIFFFYFIFFLFGEFVPCAGSYCCLSRNMGDKLAHKGTPAVARTSQATLALCLLQL